MRTAALLALAAITACGGSDPDGGRPPAQDVNPAVLDMLDTFEAEGDCASLQYHFDSANSADDVAQMVYVDAALESAGCYDD